METSDTPMTGPESLALIREMIQAAKQNLGADSFDFLLWGWLVLAAALCNYLLPLAGYPNLAGLGWAVLMPAGGGASLIYHFRRTQREKVRTPITVMLNYLWIGFAALLALMLLLGWRDQYAHTFALVIGLYGLGTFVSGGALRFRPLIVGGIACFALAAWAAFSSPQTQVLLIAVAVLAGYIIPGHLLRATYLRARTV